MMKEVGQVAKKTSLASVVTKILRPALHLHISLETIESSVQMCDVACGEHVWTCKSEVLRTRRRSTSRSTVVVMVQPLIFDRYLRAT
jgi:hypothetical protein